MNYYFLGDVGIDYYTRRDEKYLGGCSLNCCYHFFENNGKNGILIHPSNQSKDQDSINRFLVTKNIQSISLKRSGTLPTQLINNLDSGEKHYEKYTPGICEDLCLNKQELSIFKEEGQIVSPVFEQILSLANQLITLKNKYLIFDFMDCTDFDKSFRKIRKYAEHACLAFYGLTLNDKKLTKDITDFYLSTPEKCAIVTRGKDSILYFEKGQQYEHYPQVMNNVVDSTGAGDAFIGSFLAYRQRTSIHEAIENAAKYATSVLHHYGSFNQLFDDVL